MMTNLEILTDFRDVISGYIFARPIEYILVIACLLKREQKFDIFANSVAISLFSLINIFLLLSLVILISMIFICNKHSIKLKSTNRKKAL